MLSIGQKFPIGIHIGEDALYAAQFQPGGKEPKLRGLHRALFDGEGEGGAPSPDGLMSLFREISRTRRFSGGRIALHLPTQAVSSFPIRFQVAKNQGPEEAIVRGAMEHLSFPLGEAVIDYLSLAPLASGENEQKAIVTVVRRDLIEQYSSLAKRAGFALEVVDVPVCSLIRLHRALHGGSENSALLGHIGEARSHIAVLHKDDLIAERTIPWGIRTLLRKIATNMGFSEEEEEPLLLLRRYGLGYEQRKGEKKDEAGGGDGPTENLYRVIYRIIAPAVEELVDEFHQMVGYLRSEERNTPFEGIYIYGHGLSVFELDRYMEGRLNIPTSLVNPMDKLKVAGEDGGRDGFEAAPFSLALGLAMRRVPWL